jgi:subtilisin family serine protease
VRTKCEHVIVVSAGKYHALSGTSQACPHAAGVAALVLSLLPKATPSEVGSVTMTIVTR